MNNKKHHIYYFFRRPCTFQQSEMPICHLADNCMNGENEFSDNQQSVQSKSIARSIVPEFFDNSESIHRFFWSTNRLEYDIVRDLFIGLLTHHTEGIVDYLIIA